MPPTSPPPSPAIHEYGSQSLVLSYADWGNPSAPPLLLVHGGFDHARSWDDIAEGLRDRFRVIAPDLRGHGDSGWSAEARYDLNAHAEDLADLLRHLDLPRAMVVAHSYGGRAALRLAGLYPEMILGLVILEGLDPRADKRAAWRAIPVETRVREHRSRLRDLETRVERRFPSVDAAALRLRERNPRLTLNRARHLARHGTRVTADGDLRWKFDPRVGPPAPVDITPDEERRLFSRITAPTLLIHGEESASAQPEGDARVAAFPDVRVVWIPEAGHWMQHDQPALTTRVILDFLTTLPVPSPLPSPTFCGS